MPAERIVFHDLITGSNSNGKQFVCQGLFEVVIDRIPANAPQDWTMGPKQTPGKWGVYRAHGFYECDHGPYAFAVADSYESALEAAQTNFASKVCRWPRIS